MSCVSNTFVPSNANRSSELDKWENHLLNIASQPKASNSYYPKVGNLARSFSHGEALTSQTIITAALKLRGSLVGNRCITLLENCSAWFSIEGESTGCSGRTIKVMGIAPKGDIRTLQLNTGWPKGSNSYRLQSNYSTLSITPWIVYGLGNAKRKGRIAATLLFNRTYVSGGDTDNRATVSAKLNKLSIRSNSAADKIIDRDLHNLLSNTETLIYAYENIKSKPGNMTPGVSPETLDGISRDKLENLAAKLKSEQFVFSPSRKVQIPKASGGTRTLSVASPMDKIVQEAMRLILESIYEPLFKDSSHGFRPNRGCHTALKQVKQEFQPVQWVIEGDLTKFFDTISHQKLMSMIEKKIADRRFTNLIWKALKAGYFDFRKYKSNIIGTPQGSIVSPILANIFLHPFDEYMQKLKADFDQGARSTRSKESRFYEYHILKARQNNDKKRVRKLISERSRAPATDFGSDELKRLVYVRYADDWVIGIRGSKEETLSILNKVNEFLATIELKLNETKTKITSLNDDAILFLGTKIFRANHTSFSRIGPHRRLKRNKLGLRLEAPLNRINEKLSQASFMKDGKSSPKFLWLHLEHDQIILLYNSVMRGYLNYYNFAHNYGRLASYTEYILKQSCAKLLAAKFSLGTMAKVYKKFGNALTGPKGKSLFKPSYKMTLKFLTSASPIIGGLYQEKSTATLDNLKCSVCESTYRVEMHHIRAMKDLNPKISYLDRQMVRNNRKRIALCRQCHMMKHRNRETVFDKSD